MKCDLGSAVSEEGTVLGAYRLGSTVTGLSGSIR